MVCKFVFWDWLAGWIICICLLWLETTLIFSFEYLIVVVVWCRYVMTFADGGAVNCFVAWLVISGELKLSWWGACWYKFCCAWEWVGWVRLLFCCPFCLMAHAILQECHECVQRRYEGSNQSFISTWEWLQMLIQWSTKIWIFKESWESKRLQRCIHKQQINFLSSRVPELLKNHFLSTKYGQTNQLLYTQYE